VKILLATDGSEGALGAAAFLSRFPMTTADEIIIFHAVYELPLSNKELYFAMLRSIRQDLAPRVLDLTAAALGGTAARITQHQAEGYPADLVNDVAEDSNVDLVVMGARGVRGRRAETVGSVTRAVAIASSRPVLVIKQRQWDSRPPFTVLMATDGSAPSRATARFLVKLGLPQDTAVSALYVSPTGYMDIPERLALEVDNRIKDVVAARKEVDFAHAEEVLNDARSLLGARYRTESLTAEGGSPADEIEQHAARLNVDIAAVGRSGTRGARGMLGSVSRHVLGHCQCSVLIGGAGEA
jgi:nucleotide-binding universal stress UspA family protein